LLVLLAGLLGGSCGAEAPRPGELARFDFEQSSWSFRARRTEQFAHGGTWCGALEVDFGDGRTYSPLIPCGRGGTLKVTWFTRLPDLGDAELFLRIRGYADVPSQHGAIPDLPMLVGTRTLAHFDEPSLDWQAGEAQVAMDRLHPDAAWVRLEWHVLLTPAMRKARVTAGVFFDDITVCREAQS
jgi:hypothetical protein